MLLPTRRILLATLMRLHDRFCAPLKTACGRGCAACCTQKVVLTTLEGLAIYDFFMKEGPADWLARLPGTSEQGLFRPRLTLNAWAEQCLKEDAQEEEVPTEPPAAACPFLTAATCPLYPVRPLACRAMLSRAACVAGGSADMPEEVLALNIVVLQYLEAIDRPGLSGNLVDILRFVADPRHRQAYLAADLESVPEGLLVNRPLPALMVPPEHRERLRPTIEAIQDAIRCPDK